MNWNLVLGSAMGVMMAGLLPFAMFVLWRSNAVLDVRIAFINRPDFPRSFKALPSYDTMLWHPKHWRRWTVKDWQEWLDGGRA